MSFLTLCQTTRRECGIQGDGPAAVTGQTGILQKIVEFVQHADMHIQSLHPDWDFLWSEFTGSATLGADTITKPADHGQWDRESFAFKRGTTDGRHLSFVDYKIWRQYQSNKDTAEPYSLTILPNNNLALSRPSDATYTGSIYGVYWKKPTKMTANTDEPLYPERFQRAIICRAKMYFYEDQEAWDNYKAAEKEYDHWITELEGFAAPGQQGNAQAQAPEMTVRPV